MSSTSPARLSPLAFTAVVLVAAVLRLYGISGWALNNDEIAEVRWSSGSFAQMMEELRRDAVHPPLDYFVQHAIGKVGAPEWVRRLPPVLCGIASVALLMLLATWWHSPAAGVAAGLLLAVSPTHIRYSQEVRPYSMGVFFLLAGLVALELFARTRQRRWGWIWFASVFLAGATLYLAGAVAAIASITRIALDRRGALAPLWRRLPLVIVAWAVMYSPWLGVVVSAARSRPPQPAETLDWPWWQHRLQAFGTGSESYAPVTLGSWMFWIAVAGGIAVSVRAIRLRVATVWLLAGAATTIAILQVRPHYAHNPRYLIPAMVAASVLAGSAIGALWSRRATRFAAAAVFGVILVFSALTLRTYYQGDRPDWRALARYVHERAAPGESIILTNNWVVRNFGYYWLQLPRREGVHIERYVPQLTDFAGPLWIVSAQCSPSVALLETDVVRRDPRTEQAEIRYVPSGKTLALRDELCPE